MKRVVEIKEYEALILAELAESNFPELCAICESAELAHKIVEKLRE